MDWLFGKNIDNSLVPSTTPLQQQCLKQIKSLNTFNQNVIEVNRDVEYHVSFQCCAKTIALNITLPPLFPNDKPVVHVSPALKHPWVDAQMKVVGSPGLQMFYMHSDLGKVIQHIIKEFKKNPPQFTSPRDFMPPPPAGFPLSYQSPTSYPLSPTVGNLINTQTDNKLETTESRPPSYVSSHMLISNTQSNSSAEIDIIMDKLDQLQEEELERICNNPDFLLDYIHEMESVVELRNNRLKLVHKNEEIAKQNLLLEPVLDDAKSELKEIFEEYNELYHTFQGRSRKQDELSQMYNISHISTNLRISVLQAEEEAENVAEDFLHGNINLDVFLDNFLDKRKTCHLRRAKEERLKDMLPY